MTKLNDIVTRLRALYDETEGNMWPWDLEALIEELEDLVATPAPTERYRIVIHRKK